MLSKRLRFSCPKTKAITPKGQDIADKTGCPTYAESQLR